jgi:hypothetical protein
MFNSSISRLSYVISKLCVQESLQRLSLVRSVFRRYLLLYWKRSANIFTTSYVIRTSMIRLPYVPMNMPYVVPRINCSSLMLNYVCL